jgi:ATP-dependent exoDNAse (exonuclease V) alpha subunit
MNFNIDIAKQIIESNKGCFLNGLAGRGKTALVNELIKVINDDDNIKKLTPTNVSALLINGMTINKFAFAYLNNSKSITKLKNIKYIFIDEVSMMRELFYSVFLTIKFYYPEIKFIISGDFHQLEPVCDRSNFNYEKSRALYELVDGEMVHLTLCRRSDPRIPDLCDKIIGNYKYDLTPLINKNFDSYKNICFTNKTRIRINNECMVKYLENYKGKTIEVEALSYDKNTQPFTLAEGMPLISRVNNQKFKICNNETFICHKIKTDFIIVKNEIKEELEIPINIFNKMFLLQFCITTHKSQGLSFNYEYCIHEVNKFNNKLLYVALSRSTEYDNVNIIMDENELADYYKELFHNGNL